MHHNGNFQLVTIMPGNQQCGSLGTIVTQSFMHVSKNSCRKNIQYVNIRKKKKSRNLTYNKPMSFFRTRSVSWKWNIVGYLMYYDLRSVSSVAVTEEATT